MLLVADADAAVAGDVGRALAASGFPSLSIQDGVTAVEELARDDSRLPDVTLLDLDMPNGLAVIERLRSHPHTRSLPIVLLGTPDRAVCDAGLALGADDFVSRTIEAPDLAMRLRLQARRSLDLNRLREEMLVDELTGIRNRRGLIESLNTELSRARRIHRRLGVLLIDVNEFKSINDTFGHATGDQVLCDLARCLDDATRATDVVGRLGGDEFLVVLPDVGEDVGDRLAFRLSRKAADISVGPEGWPLRISIGFAACRIDGDDIDSLLHRADRRMYRRKRISEQLNAIDAIAA